MDTDTINALLRLIQDTHGAAAAGIFIAIATALKGLVSLWQLPGWQALLGKISAKLLWVNWKPLVKAAFVGGIALVAAVCTGIATGLGWPAIVIGGLSAGVVAALGAMGVNSVTDAATGGAPPANPTP